MLRAPAGRPRALHSCRKQVPSAAGQLYCCVAALFLPPPYGTAARWSGAGGERARISPPMCPQSPSLLLVIISLVCARGEIARLIPSYRHTGLHSPASQPTVCERGARPEGLARRRPSANTFSSAEPAPGTHDIGCRLANRGGGRGKRRRAQKELSRGRDWNGNGALSCASVSAMQACAERRSAAGEGGVEQRREIIHLFA